MDTARTSSLCRRGGFWRRSGSGWTETLTYCGKISVASFRRDLGRRYESLIEKCRGCIAHPVTAWIKKLSSAKIDPTVCSGHGQQLADQLFRRRSIWRSTKRPHLSSRTMKFSMTSGAKGYQIFLAVFTQATPKLNMVNLQFARPSTVLASPTISFHDLAAEPNVAITSEPYSRLLRLRTIHADSFRLLINSSF
jgi:hypothetical protein